MIKAIETRYSGYRFRSRLEARWAVFLDKIGSIDWQYEYEGYELPSGWYLPDFRLIHDKWWLEIKAEEPTEKERRLCGELAHELGAEVQIIWGLPPGDGAIGFAGGRYALNEPQSLLGTPSRPWFTDHESANAAANAAKSARFGRRGRG